MNRIITLKVILNYFLNNKNMFKTSFAFSINYIFKQFILAIIYIYIFFI